MLDELGREDVALAPTVCAAALPSGPVTDEAWDALLDRLLSSIRDEGSVDGGLFALHGAMLTESADDPEGILLAQVRDRRPWRSRRARPVAKVLSSM